MGKIKMSFVKQVVDLQKEATSMFGDMCMLDSGSKEHDAKEKEMLLKCAEIEEKINEIQGDYERRTVGQIFKLPLSKLGEILTVFALCRIEVDYEN